MPRGSFKKTLIPCLRQGNGKRHSRSRSKDQSQKILELVSIYMRPPKIEERLIPGHWGATSSLALTIATPSVRWESAPHGW